MLVWSRIFTDYYDENNGQYNISYDVDARVGHIGARDLYFFLEGCYLIPAREGCKMYPDGW